MLQAFVQAPWSVLQGFFSLPVMLLKLSRKQVKCIQRMCIKMSHVGSCTALGSICYLWGIEEISFLIGPTIVLARLYVYKVLHYRVSGSQYQHL